MLDAKDVAATVLRIVPVDLKTANDFVRRLHRHSRPVIGHKFAVGVEACTLMDGAEQWARCSGTRAGPARRGTRTSCLRR